MPSALARQGCKRKGYGIESKYKSVFGELPKNQVTDVIKNTQTDVKSDVSVSEMVKKYESMSDNERLEFLAEINREFKNYNDK